MDAENKIRVVIADDHRLFREGLRLVLQDENSIQIVGEAVNGIQAIDLVNELKPDVVLLNTNMPQVDGIQILPLIREKSPQSKALMFNPCGEEGTTFDALKAGAKGCLSNCASPSDLIKAIVVIHSGEVWIERTLMARFLESETVSNLHT